MIDFQDSSLFVGDSLKALARNALRFGHGVVMANFSPPYELLSNLKAFYTLDQNQPLSVVIDKILESGEYTFRYILIDENIDSDQETMTKFLTLGSIVRNDPVFIRKSKNKHALMEISSSWGFNYIPDIAKVKNLDRSKSILSKAIVASSNGESIIIAIIICFNSCVNLNNLTYPYKGYIFPHPFAKEIEPSASNIADSLSVEFNIRGLWEFEFIYDGNIYVTDINISLPSSLDLINIASMNDLFKIHIDANFTIGKGISIDPGDSSCYHGLIDLFAPDDLIFNSTDYWLSANGMNIPLPDKQIKKNEKILSIKSSNRKYTQLVADLHREASNFYSSNILPISTKQV